MGFLGLLPFVGTWIGHTLEYLRVFGSSGNFTAQAFGSIHAYMVPLAAVLMALVGVFATELVRTWTRLGRRLDAARVALRGLWRGHLPPDSMPCRGSRQPSVSSLVAVAWPALTALQIGLHLIQENCEAITGGLPAPGWGPVRGAHALVPLIHAGVALALVVSTAAVLRVLHRRADVVAAVQALVAHMIRRLRRLRDAPMRVASQNGAPFELHGFDLYCRPPPGLLAI